MRITMSTITVSSNKGRDDYSQGVTWKSVQTRVDSSGQSVIVGV